MATRPRAAELLTALNGCVAILVGGLLLIAILAIALQVGVRFVLTQTGFAVSVPWTEELCRYSITWAVFLGAAVLCRDARLIAVDLVLHQTPAPVARVVEAVATLVTLLFFVALGTLGLRMAVTGLHETSPVMKIPMIWVYVAVPVSSVLAVVNSIARIRNTLAGTARPEHIDLADLAE